MRMEKGIISVGIENDFEISELQFELEFSPAFVEIIGVTALERTTFDSVIIENNIVTLNKSYYNIGSW